MKSLIKNPKILELLAEILEWRTENKYKLIFADLFENGIKNFAHVERLDFRYGRLCETIELMNKSCDDSLDALFENELDACLRMIEKNSKPLEIQATRPAATLAEIEKSNLSKIQWNEIMQGADSEEDLKMDSRYSDGFVEKTGFKK